MVTHRAPTSFSGLSQEIEYVGKGLRERKGWSRIQTWLTMEMLNLSMLCFPDLLTFWSEPYKD